MLHPQSKAAKCAHCAGKKNNVNLCPKHVAALQKLWYGKLKDKGFDDIEQDEETLKMSSKRVFSGLSNGSFFGEKRAYYDSVEEYYRLAGQFLHEHKFKNKAEKAIWEMHSDGISIRQIAEKLQQKGAPKAYRRAVHELIQSLSKLMVDTCLKRTD